MNIIRQLNFVYTLYEDEAGIYVFELLLPSPANAAALYTKEVKVSGLSKWWIRMRPETADRMADRLIRKEKARQAASTR